MSQDHATAPNDVAKLGPANDRRSDATREGEAASRCRDTWDRTVPEVFAEQVARAPDAIALVQGRQRLTYRELDQWSDRIARRLAGLGLGPGSRVGTYLERTPDSVASLLAVLKIGAAYVPFDPTYPVPVLRQAMEISGIAAMIVHRSDWDGVPDQLGWKGPLLQLDGDLDDLGTLDADRPRSPARDPNDLAYIMFTSGSTGRPKGVMVPHRGIVRLVRDADYAEFGPHHVFMLLAPLAFDASTFEIWGALLNGGTLVLAPSNLPSVREIADTIRDGGVTTLWLTSGLFHLIVDQHVEALRPLKQLLSGGDVLSPSHVEKARVALPACQLINGYGPTENTTFTCCYAIPRDRPVTAAIPIGIPVAHTTVRILDEAHRPVPDGEVGQLCTGGAGLALGYLDDPELTARKFIRDPQDAGARLYLTGDLVRRDRDGNLHFLGRVDRQVKINGKRLELEEVENALRSYPGVRDAAVLLREDCPGLKRLAAYVSGVPDSPHVIEPLRAFLRARLPEHALPAALVVLDALPLSPVGKLDRAALPVPKIEPPRPRFERRDALEQALADIWGRVLRLDEVGTTTNFFDLGGTSLQLIEAVERIQASLHPGLKTADLFEHPSIQSLAAFIRGNDGAPRSIIGNQARARRGNDTLARLQQRRARPVA